MKLLLSSSEVSEVVSNVNVIGLKGIFSHDLSRGLWNFSANVNNHNTDQSREQMMFRLENH